MTPVTSPTMTNSLLSFSGLLKIENRKIKKMNLSSLVSTLFMFIQRLYISAEATGPLLVKGSQINAITKIAQNLNKKIYGNPEIETVGYTKYFYHCPTHVNPS